MKTKHNPKSVSFGVLLAATLLLCGSLFGQEKPQKDPRADLPVERSIELEPSADAYVVLPDVTASFLADGSVRVNIRGTISPDDPPRNILLGVDLEKGIYVTRPYVDLELDSSEDEKSSLSLRSGKAAAQSASSSTSWTRNNSVVAATVPAIGALAPPTTKWARIRLETTDPVNLKLTESHLELSWEILGSTVDWRWVRGICIGHRTILTTDWFVDYCYPNGYPYFEGPSKVCQEGYAGYHNYDFPCLSIHAPTYVDHG